MWKWKSNKPFSPQLTLGYGVSLHRQKPSLGPWFHVECALLNTRTWKTVFGITVWGREERLGLCCKPHITKQRQTWLRQLLVRCRTLVLPAELARVPNAGMLTQQLYLVKTAILWIIKPPREPTVSCVQLLCSSCSQPIPLFVSCLPTRAGLPCHVDKKTEAAMCHIRFPEDG